MPYDNPLRETLESGEVAFGASASTQSPTMFEVYADLGLDYVWVDFEHIGPASADAPAFEAVRRATDAAGIEPLVRIESPDPHVVRKVLDAGIRNIVLPRVETAEEVRRAVEASRFVYDGEPGERGVGTSLASNWGDRPEGYADHEDGSVVVGVMLENETALDNVEDILAVPELGFGWIGPADLSTSMGRPLGYDHPEVREAIDGFREAFVDAGVPVGISLGYLDGIEAGVEAGYGLLTLGSEVGAARTLLGERLDAARDAA